MTFSLYYTSRWTREKMLASELPSVSCAVGNEIQYTFIWRIPRAPAYNLPAFKLASPWNRDEWAWKDLVKEAGV